MTCSFTSYRSCYLRRICSWFASSFSTFAICIAWILSELSFFLVYAQHMWTATLTVSHSNHLVNLLFHSLDFQRWCFHRSSMFLYAQLMLRICSVEILVIRYELFCGLAWWSWHMLRIDFEAFPTRRQILNVRGICYLSSSTRRQEIFPTPAQLFQPPGELHPLLGRVRTCLKHVFWLSSLG